MAIIQVKERFGDAVTLFIFMDDIIMMMHKAMLKDLMEALKAELKKHGLTLRMKKCMAMLTDAEDQIISPEVEAAGLRQVWGQMPILGSGLADEFEFQLRVLNRVFEPFFARIAIFSFAVSSFFKW